MARAVEPGTYRAKAILRDGEIIAWGRTKDKNIQCLVQMIITQGPAKGVQLPWLGYFTPLRAGKKKSGTDVAMQSLRAMGWEGDELADIEAKDLAKEVEIVIVDQEVEGGADEHGRPTGPEVYSKIQYVNTIGGGFQLRDRVGRDELRQWSASMRQVASAGAARGGGDPPPNVDDFGPGPDDDIPF